MSTDFLLGVYGRSTPDRYKVDYKPGVNNKCRCGAVVQLKYSQCYSCHIMNSRRAYRNA